MSTIVILVLAMSMLVLGLVLVKTIFKGASSSVDTIDKKLEGEINKLFSEDKKLVIHLPNSIAEIDSGEPFGVAFGIQNSGQSGNFEWDVELADTRVNEKCGISNQQAENWISTGGKDTIDIPSGDSHTDIVFFNIPEGQVTDISTCLVRFKMVVTRDGSPYETGSFNVQVR